MRKSPIRPDRGGLHDEAHGKRRDDRRNAQRLDERVIAEADDEADDDDDKKARQDHAVFDIHKLQRHRAGKRHGGGNREIDVAGTKRDDEHLADPDDDRKGREGERGLRQAERAGAECHHDRQEPDDKGGKPGPDPGFAEKAQEGDHRRFSRFSRRFSIRRSASTMMRIAPCAPICQSGEMRRKDRNEPASVSVSAPITAPIGRDAAADELAATEDHAGDRQQRVAQRDISIGRGGQADEGDAGKNREKAGKAHRRRRAPRQSTSRRARQSAGCRRRRG